MFLYNSLNISSSRALEKENPIIGSQIQRFCKQNSQKNTSSILKSSLLFTQNTHSIYPTRKPRLNSKNSFQSSSTLQEEVPAHIEKIEGGFRVNEPENQRSLLQILKDLQDQQSQLLKVRLQKKRFYDESLEKVGNAYGNIIGKCKERENQLQQIRELMESVTLCQ